MHRSLVANELVLIPPKLPNDARISINTESEITRAVHDLELIERICIVNIPVVRIAEN